MTIGEAVAAVALLTPLILGVLAFLEKFINRKRPDPPKSPEVVQGMTISVDYAAELLKELKEDRARAEGERDEAKARADRLQIQLDTYKAIRSKDD